MFGLAVAIVCAICLLVLTRAKRRHYFRRSFVSHLLSRLDTSPGQERALREIFFGLSQEMSEFRQKGRIAAKELGTLFSEEHLAGDALEAWIIARENEMRPLRDRLKAALLDAHGVLDARQRETLSRIFLRNPPSHLMRHHHFGCSHHHHPLSPTCA